MKKFFKDQALVVFSMTYACMACRKGKRQEAHEIFTGVVGPRSEVYASPTAVDFLQFWIIDVQILSGESGSPVQVSVTRFRLILYVVVSVSALY